MNVFHLRFSWVAFVMVSWELLIQTCWWPLSDHWSMQFTSPHLSGSVFYGGLESLMDLSALCLAVERIFLYAQTLREMEHMAGMWHKTGRITMKLLRISENYCLQPSITKGPWISSVCVCVLPIHCEVVSCIDFYHCGISTLFQQGRLEWSRLPINGTTFTCVCYN